MSKTDLSRRALIAGAAALAAIPVAAQSADGPSIPNVEAPPDAELVALGEHFENLLREYVAVDLRKAPLERSARAEVQARLGLREFSDTFSNDQKAKKLFRRICSRNGARAAAKRKDKLADEMCSTEERIIEAEASTLGGLRAKALVAFWEACGSLIHGEPDFDSETFRSLFYATAAMTGLVPLVQEIEAWNAVRSAEWQRDYDAHRSAKAVTS
jgi:hypothetical protein